MESEDILKDPLNVEELIRQALAQQKKWRKPSNEPVSRKVKPWQQIMDDRLYKGGYKGS